MKIQIPPPTPLTQRTAAPVAAPTPLSLPNLNQRFSTLYDHVHCSVSIAEGEFGPKVRVTIPKGSSITAARDEILKVVGTDPDCTAHSKEPLSLGLIGKNLDRQMDAATTVEFYPIVAGGPSTPGIESHLDYLAEHFMKPVDPSYLALAYGAFRAAGLFLADGRDRINIRMAQAERRDDVGPFAVESIYHAPEATTNCNYLTEINKWGTGTKVTPSHRYGTFGISGEPIPRESWKPSALTDFDFKLSEKALELGVPIVMANGISVTKRPDGAFEVNIPQTVKSVNPRLPDYSPDTTEGVERLFKEMNRQYQDFMDAVPHNAPNSARVAWRSELLRNDLFELIRDADSHLGVGRKAIPQETLSKFLLDIPGKHIIRIDPFVNHEPTDESKLANPFVTFIALSVLEFTSVNGYRTAIGAEPKSDLYIRTAGGKQTHDVSHQGPFLPMAARYFHDGFTTHEAIKLDK